MVGGYPMCDYFKWAFLSSLPVTYEKVFSIVPFILRPDATPLNLEPAIVRHQQRQHILSE